MATEDVIHDHQPSARAEDGPHPRVEAATNGQGPGTLDEDGPTRLRREFAPRFDEAWARCRAASDEMHAAADALREHGRPPSYGLVYALGECHREFLRLASELARRAESLSVSLHPIDTQGGISELGRLLESLGGELPELPPPTAHTPVEEPVAETLSEKVSEAMPAPTEPVFTVPDAVEESPAPEPEPEPERQESLTAATSGLEPERQERPPDAATSEPEPERQESPPDVATEETQHPGESVRLYALGVLDTIALLRYRGGGEFPPLKECQARAEALREEIAKAPASNLPEEAAQLAAGEHAFDGLLDVVSGIQTLNDAEWAAVHARVSEAFGRQLAVAAARGRLVVAPPGQGA